MLIDARCRLAGTTCAAVVLVHGKDDCRSDVLRASGDTLVEAFVGAGIAVLMIDLRGHGASGNGRSTYGHQERQDVLGAVDWLRAQGDSQIGLPGALLGAASSLFAAADDPLIGAVVAGRPFADFGEMIDRQYSKLSHLPAFLLPGALAVAFMSGHLQAA